MYHARVTTRSRSLARLRNIETVRRAVVRLIVFRLDTSNQPVITGFGSGFLIDEGLDGNPTIVSAAHVVQRCRRPLVVFADGTIIQGRVTGMASWPDLARITVPAIPADTPAVPFRDLGEQPLSVGERVATVGYGYGVDHSAGPVLPAVLPGYVTSTDTSEGIQLDAHCGPGASGAPVVDGRGRAVGVLVGGYVMGTPGNTVSRAVPLTPASRQLWQQLADGDIEVGCVGFGVGQIDPVATLLRGETTQPCEITHLTTLGAAERAGLRIGDRLLSLTNATTGDRFSPSVPSLAKFEFYCNLREGAPVQVEFMRDGLAQQTTLLPQTSTSYSLEVLAQRLGLYLRQDNESKQRGCLTVDTPILRVAEDWRLPCDLELTRHRGWRRASRKHVWGLCPRLRRWGRQPVLRRNDVIAGMLVQETISEQRRLPWRRPARTGVQSANPIESPWDLYELLSPTAEFLASGPQREAALLVRRGNAATQPVFLPRETWLAIPTRLWQFDTRGIT